MFCGVDFNARTIAPKALAGALWFTFRCASLRVYVVHRNNTARACR
jgi:hypothetical protein